jgi:Flp pilus assembly protein TadG
MRIFRRLKDSRGTNLLEGAIITPLLLLVTFAIVDFGLFFYAYLALENGVSQATRYGITGQTMAGLNRVDSIKTAMRNATPTLTIPDAAFSFSSMAVGGTNWAPGPGTPGQILRVTVTYPWEFWTPLIRPLFTNGRVNISVDSIMVTEPVFTQ